MGSMAYVGETGGAAGTHRRVSARSWSAQVCHPPRAESVVESLSGPSGGTRVGGVGLFAIAQMDPFC
jgi:hypothetical protein